MKKIDTFVLGNAQVNCYLLWNDDHVLIIDPGTKGARLQDTIDHAQATVDGIVLTHGHFDHIGGVDALVEKYHCPVYMNDLDVAMLMDPKLNASMYMSEPIQIYTQPIVLLPGKHKIGQFDITWIDAPGHSEGCSMILWDDNLFCGDVLFQGSIGRTDLIGGSNSKMAQSLKNIKTLDPNLHVYPGHGPKSTLKEELLYNPYLQM